MSDLKKMRELNNKLDNFLAEIKREKALQEDKAVLANMLGEQLIESVTPILQTVEDTNKNTLEAVNKFSAEVNKMTEAISKIQINVPEIKSPQINIPDIKVETPKIPPISIPKSDVVVDTTNIEKTLQKGLQSLKPPIVNVPQAKVNLKVPDFPKEMDIRGWVGLQGVDLANPLPVQLRTPDGKPFEFGSSSSSGGRSGLSQKDSQALQTIAANGDPWLEHAKRIIKKDFGDVVSLEAKDKDLLKFGRSTQIQTDLTTIMTLPSGTYNETYVSDNTISVVSSSQVGDTTTLVVEGHTIDSDSNLTFVTQEITLNGQNQVSLTTPLARATRAYNSGSTDLTGDIYVYEDTNSAGGVPSNASKVHLMIAAGLNQSEKCSTSISNNDYWIVTKIYADILTKLSSYAEVLFEIRRKGGVFREVASISASDAHNGVLEFKPYIIVPKNADTRLRAKADVNGRDVSGGIVGTLLTIIS